MPRYRLYRIYYLSTGAEILPMENAGYDPKELCQVAAAMIADDDEKGNQLDYFVRPER